MGDAGKFLPRTEDGSRLVTGFHALVWRRAAPSAACFWEMENLVMMLTPRLTIAMLYAVGSLGLVATIACDTVARAAGM